MLDILLVITRVISIFSASESWGLASSHLVYALTLKMEVATTTGRWFFIEYFSPG